MSDAQHERAMSASSAAFDPELAQALSGVKRTRSGSRKHASAAASAAAANKRSIASAVRKAKRKRYARAQPHIVSTNQAYLQTPLASDVHATTAGDAGVGEDQQTELGMPMSMPMHFDANIDPALAGASDVYGVEGHQQPPQYVNGLHVDASAHPPLAPGQSDGYAHDQTTTTTPTPSTRSQSKKGRGVTRFWLNNSSIASSIAAQRAHPSNAGIRMPGDDDTATLSVAEADAARAQQAAQHQQQTEVSLRQGAVKFGRRKLAEASRSHARDAYALLPLVTHNGYGIGVGVGVGVGGLVDQYPPMNVDAGMQEGDQQEFELPYDIQWAAENGELDNKKRPSTYQKIRSNYFTERSRLAPSSTTRIYDEIINGSLADQVAVPVKVQWTSDKGHGLFAQEAIASGQFVIDYRGEVISLRTYLSRCTKQYSKSNCFYAVGYDQDEVLDAGIRANEARFVNHSCAPNLELRRVSLLNQGVDEYEFGFWALRDIMPGEEMTFDYNETTWLPTKPTECRCGAPNCAKVLGRRPGDKTRREFRLLEAISRSAGKARAERVTRKKTKAKGDSMAMTKYKSEIAELKRLRVLRHAEADALLESQAVTAPVTVEEPAPPPAPTKKRKGKGRKAAVDAPPQTAEEAAAAAEEAKKARISGWAEWLRKKAAEQTRTADEWLEFANKRRRGKAWMQRMMQEFGVAEYPGGPAMPFTPTIEIPKNGQPNKRGPPPGTPRPPRASKKDKLAKAAEAAAAEQQDAVKSMEGEGEPGSSTGPGTHEGELAAAAEHLMGQGGHEHMGEQVQLDEHGNELQIPMEHQHQHQHQHQQDEQQEQQEQQQHLKSEQAQDQDGMLLDQAVQENVEGEGVADLEEAAIDPALIAALVEHHQRQAEYDAGQTTGQQGVGVGIGVGIGVGAGAPAGTTADDTQHVEMHAQDPVNVAYEDEHGHPIISGYDFFEDEAALALAAAAAQGELHDPAQMQGQIQEQDMGHEQGQIQEQEQEQVQVEGLGQEIDPDLDVGMEPELEHQMEVGMEVEDDGGEQELENAVLRQQAEDIVSSILPRHLQ